MASFKSILKYFTLTLFSLDRSISSKHFPFKGRTIRKVMGGGGGAKAKIKIEQGKQTKKKIRAPEMFEKKKFVQRLFNRENYKLTWPIRGAV